MSETYVALTYKGQVDVNPDLLDAVADPSAVLLHAMQQATRGLFTSVARDGGLPPEDVRVRLMRGDVMHGSRPESVVATARARFPEVVAADLVERAGRESGNE